VYFDFRKNDVLFYLYTDRRKVIIIAVSLGLGLGLALVPDVFAKTRTGTKYFQLSYGHCWAYGDVIELAPARTKRAGIVKIVSRATQFLFSLVRGNRFYEA
jgi:hypothetical protein